MGHASVGDRPLSIQQGSPDRRVSLGSPTRFRSATGPSVVRDVTDITNCDLPTRLIELGPAVADFCGGGVQLLLETCEHGLEISFP
jgi:hypothetical protein